MRRLRALLGLAFAACASTQVAPRTAPGVALESEERGMLRLADEARDEIDRSGKVVADAGLDAYLLGVARRLEPPEAFAAIPFRVRVLRDVQPNAFCLPNGAIYVNTGMLARLESEAELASLLGHEMVHATHRHALRQLRSSQNTGAVTATLGALLGMGARPGGLIYMASVSGYHRDLEREADREGLARVAAAGYRVAEAPRLFERLRDWAAAEEQPEGSAFYSSHPQLEERIASAREAARAAGDGSGVRSAEAYSRATARILLENARMELVAGRFADSRGQVERYLTLRPDDAAGHLAAGELARREGAAGAGDAALASYRRAVKLAPRTAEAWRGIGLVLQGKGDLPGARKAFARYLELAPGAPDRAYIRAALQEPAGGRP